MKKIILELLIIFGLILLEKSGELSFFQSCIIFLFIITVDIAIQKLNNIEKQLNIIIHIFTGNGKRGGTSNDRL